MDISVVVPTHNRPEHLRRCLLALLQQSHQPDHFEVIVVDDGSVSSLEPIIEVIKPKGLDVRLVRIDHSGPARARNCGIESASGDLLGFLDDDAVPDSNWVAEAVSFMANHPEIAAAVGYISPVKRVGHGLPSCYVFS